MITIVFISILTSACLTLMKVYTWFYYAVLTLAGVLCFLAILGLFTGPRNDNK